eukprot:TRINITY_DN22088_c0_g1_i1.p1 TRINITY_DN22088_c0_g1~~TRINITY_DN22088_c0_g1_i1.p1  ORF type:complete len:251 (+),score=107.83 TRINITY_DN22088_c0_g1_i1:55-807(+)
MSARPQLLNAALVAEGCRRYEQMGQLMKEIAEMDVGLTDDERQALTVAYQRILEGKVEGIAKLNSKISAVQLKGGNADVAAALGTLKNRLYTEIRTVCAEVSDLIAGHLLPAATSAESQVFYRKWQADILRLAATYTLEAGKDEQAGLLERAEAAYNTATEEALLSLPPANPTRLALALHLATFTAEVLKDPQAAADIANVAIEDSAGEWPVGASDSAAVILHLLQRNAALWCPEDGHDEEDLPATTFFT